MMIVEDGCLLLMIKRQKPSQLATYQKPSFSLPKS